MKNETREKKDYYTYRIIWSEEDLEYVGLCAEFPSLSWLADTQEGALQGIKNIVSEVISDMEVNGETVPEPISGKHYSGKLSLRMPPYVHRELAMKAAEAKVSLNHYVITRLANY
ncbi:MAG: toxin-antitoxin system HicB family antitoxin [Desulfosporosinus sp.]